MPANEGAVRSQRKFSNCTGFICFAVIRQQHYFFLHEDIIGHHAAKPPETHTRFSAEPMTSQEPRTEEATTRSSFSSSFSSSYLFSVRALSNSESTNAVTPYNSPMETTVVHSPRPISWLAPRQLPEKRKRFLAPAQQKTSSASQSPSCHVPIAVRRQS